MGVPGRDDELFEHANRGTLFVSQMQSRVRLMLASYHSKSGKSRHLEQLIAVEHDRRRWRPCAYDSDPAMHLALPPFPATASALGKDAAVNSYQEIATEAGLTEGVCLKFRHQRSLHVLELVIDFGLQEYQCMFVSDCSSSMRAKELSDGVLLCIIRFIGSIAERRQPERRVRKHSGAATGRRSSNDGPTQACT
jgi:hypothetical protein